MAKKARLIAEIGCNHMGQMDTALALIKSAVLECGVSTVKFQKRSPRELLSEDQYHAPHPNPMHAYGDTYGQHREALELSLAQHAELKKYTESLGGVYSCSVFDMTSAQEIASLNPQYIKIPAGQNTNVPMLSYLCENFKGDIHVSLGMTTYAEENALLALFQKYKREKNLLLYACTTGYPVPFNEVCLLEITRLISSYGNLVGSIGFSGHHFGIAADIAAYTLGATDIERHFTLDRTWKGTDHSASLEPAQLKQLAVDLDNVHESLTYKPSQVLPSEEPHRDRAKHIEK